MEQALRFGNLSIPRDPPKNMKASFSTQQGLPSVRAEIANYPEAWLQGAHPWVKKITILKICKAAFL
jgi:hypothetical protein